MLLPQLCAQQIDPCPQKHHRGHSIQHADQKYQSLPNHASLPACCHWYHEQASLLKHRYQTQYLHNRQRRWEQRGQLMGQLLFYPLNGDNADRQG